MLPRADAQPPTRRLSGEFDTEQLITFEAAEAEESSEDESDEKMAAVRFTSESQGGGNSESSSSHESHEIIGQMNEMLTLKRSSCPHLDGELYASSAVPDDSDDSARPTRRPETRGSSWPAPATGL